MFNSICAPVARPATYFSAVLGLRTSQATYQLIFTHSDVIRWRAVVDDLRRNENKKNRMYTVEAAFPENKFAKNDVYRGMSLAENTFRASYAHAE